MYFNKFVWDSQQVPAKCEWWACALQLRKVFVTMLLLRVPMKIARQSVYASEKDKTNISSKSLKAAGRRFRPRRFDWIQTKPFCRLMQFGCLWLVDTLRSVASLKAVGLGTKPPTNFQGITTRKWHDPAIFSDNGASAELNEAKGYALIVLVFCGVFLYLIVVPEHLSWFRSAASQLQAGVHLRLDGGRERLKWINFFGSSHSYLFLSRRHHELFREGSEM